MNIDDFLITVALCLLIGALIGFFLRDILRFAIKQYIRYIRKPKHFKPIRFDESDI